MFWSLRSLLHRFCITMCQQMPQLNSQLSCRPSKPRGSWNRPSSRINSNQEVTRSPPSNSTTSHQANSSNLRKGSQWKGNRSSSTSSANSLSQATATEGQLLAHSPTTSPSFPASTCMGQAYARSTAASLSTSAWTNTRFRSSWRRTRISWWKYFRRQGKRTWTTTS